MISNRTSQYLSLLLLEDFNDTDADFLISLYESTFNESIGVYIGINKYSEEFNNHLFFVYPPTSMEARRLSNYKLVDTFIEHEDYIALVIKCNNRDSVKKFLQGKYTEIYNGTSFVQDESMPFLSKVRKVLLRDENLRNEMAESIGVSLNLIDQLDSIPELEQEIYNYGIQATMDSNLQRSEA